jgi:hypothetical protein
MKIYVAVVEALRKNERQGETQFITKIDGFLSPPFPPWMLMFLFQDFFESHSVYYKVNVLMLYILILHITLLYFYYTPLMNTFNEHIYLQIYI